MSPLYEPRDVNFEELLLQKYNKTYVQKHKWKYYDHFTMLLKKRLFSKRKEVWHVVSSTALRRKYGRAGKRGTEQWVHRIIREDFKDWGVVLHHTEQVEERKRISRYKILDERMRAGFRLVDTVLPRQHAPQKPAPIMYTGVHGKIQRTTATLRIDYAAALAFTEDAYARSMNLRDKPVDWAVVKTSNWSNFRNRVVDASIYSRWLWHLHKLNLGTYRFKVDFGGTERVYYLLTQIPSHLRSFILLRGKRLVEVDITAAQPLLFTLMVLEYCQQQGITVVPDDVWAWKSLCEEPDPEKSLYQTLHRLMDNAKLALDSHLTVDPITGTIGRVRRYTKLFKAEFFAKIFFDKEKDTQMRRVFAKEFPTVSDAITYYKQGNHRKLAISLQRMEAGVVVGKVCARLYTQKIKALPVHDAIFVPEEHVEATLAEIKKAFNEINLNVQVKIKIM